MLRTASGQLCSLLWGLKDWLPPLPPPSGVPPLSAPPHPPSPAPWAPSDPGSQPFDEGLLSYQQG